MNRPGLPLKQINVTPLASESFGVRSMCTLVGTPDTVVLLDAGISLCPWRFNLPPHPFEFQTIQNLRAKIAQAADNAQIVTISHYHYDHHTPSFEDWVVNWTAQTETARQIYKNKIVLIKNPKENINASQRERAATFLKTGAKHAKNVEYADGKTFVYGNTQLRFSEAVAHGEDNSMLGYVIMVTIQYGDERFMFAPDIQGPMSNHATQLILDVKPSLLMLGGPPFYLSGFRVNEAALQNATNNLKAIVEKVPITIIEHHTLRDEFWKQKVAPIEEHATKAGHSLLTAAEYIGEENRFLESNRKRLFRDFPPSKDFQFWTKTLNNKVIGKPPI
ncbi:MAG: MBL fold metallo-hydrolase [Candidatus Bathyarchaeia archaeon]|jgi:predicted metallo-beta-lactamase superfamily hydrolase